MSRYEVPEGGVSIRKPRSVGGGILLPGTIVRAEMVGGETSMQALITAGHLIPLADDPVIDSEGRSQSKSESERQAKIQSDHEAEIAAMRRENEALRAGRDAPVAAVAPVVEAPEAVSEDAPVAKDSDPGGVKMTHTEADLRALISDLTSEDDRLALLCSMVESANEKFVDKTKVFDMPLSVADAIALLTLDTEYHHGSRPALRLHQRDPPQEAPPLQDRDRWHR